VKLLVHAGGYTRSPWWNDERKEIRSTLHPICGGDGKSKWSPSSKDFQIVGRNAGGSWPASSVDGLLNVINDQAPESIEEMRVLGHAGSDPKVLALAGEVVTDKC
jgi:hypothetical protein